MGSVLIASRNPSKISNMRELLKTAGFHALTLEEAGIEPIEIEETGKTAEENAILKATEYQWYSGMMTFAEDVAMYIDGLGGLPGTQVRRWNGKFPSDISDKEWLNFFLEETNQIPSQERTGKFVSVWCIVNEAGCPFVHTVSRQFTFAEKPMREMVPGFPMSSIIREGSLNDVLESLYLPEFKVWALEEQMFKNS